MTLFTPDGKIVEDRATLPAGDLRLSDGRLLRLQGPGPMPGTLWWQTPNGLRVLASRDSTQHGMLLHVSISYKNRNPSWDDIKAVRAAFYPGNIDVMMMLPKEEDYVNLHEHVFHLWQTPVSWGIQ